MRKAHAECMLVHKHVEQEPYFERDYPFLHEYLTGLNGQDAAITVSQVTFFSRAIDRRCKSIPESIKNSHVLATVVLVTTHSTGPDPDPRTFVYEAIVARPALAVTPNLPNYYYHVFSRITVFAGARQFAIRAAYFIQQNGTTAVCAHVALQMALFHVERSDWNETPGGKLVPTVPSAKINSIVEEFRASQALAPGQTPTPFDPSEGLSLDDIHAVLDQYDLASYALNTVKYPQISAYNYAYLLVESGIPTLIAFSPSRTPITHDPPDETYLHVIHAVGHTTNYDEWLPMALASDKYESPNQRDRKYISSAYWAPHLIVHDDTLGPYHCLGEGDLTYFSPDVASAIKQERASNRAEAGTPEPSEIRLLGETGTRIRYVVGIAPRSAKSETVSPYTAEDLAFRAIASAWTELLSRLASPWRERLSEVSLKQLVLRTQLISRKRYITHITTAEDHNARMAKSKRSAYGRFVQNLESLPEKFWVTEFSLPDLFSVNRSKLGEALIDFSPPLEALNPDTVDSIEGACLAVRMLGETQFRDFGALRVGFTSHTPLIRRRSLAALDF